MKMNMSFPALLLMFMILNYYQLFFVGIINSQNDYFVDDLSNWGSDNLYNEAD